MYQKNLHEFDILVHFENIDVKMYVADAAYTLEFMVVLHIESKRFQTEKIRNRRLKNKT